MADPDEEARHSKATAVANRTVRFASCASNFADVQPDCYCNLLGVNNWCMHSKHLVFTFLENCIDI